MLLHEFCDTSAPARVPSLVLQLRSGGGSFTDAMSKSVVCAKPGKSKEGLTYRTCVRYKFAMLTEKQQAILDFINDYVKENGFPPSVREIGRQFGIYPATVQDHISALERKGYLQKKANQSRTLSVPASSRPSSDDNGIPVLGRVAAGMPLLAQQNIEDM